MKKLAKIFNRHGDNYIDTALSIIVFVVVIVAAINIFTVISEHIKMDQVARNLIDVASFSGRFGPEFEDCIEDMHETYGDFEVEYGPAKTYYNSTKKEVQLGETMVVVVKRQTALELSGIVHIPITCTATKQGVSREYWKT